MSKKRKEKKAGKKEKSREGWVTLATLEICMISIQFALCMQLGFASSLEPFVFSLAICIHPQLLSSWSHNMNAVFSPGFF